MVERRWSARLPLFAAGRPAAITGTVGVHVTESRLAAVRLLASAPLPAVEAARQSNFDPGNSASAIRALAQAGFFAGARVIVTLPGGKYDAITIASPPAVPEEELHDALRWQMRGVLPYPPEDATFDFVHLPQGARGAAGSASGPSVLVIAARRRDIAQALAPFQAAGVEVEVIDIPEMAQRNLLGVGANAEASRGFLSFDDSSMLLTVQLVDELCFARRMQLPNVGMLDDDEPEHVADRIATNVQRSLEVFARQSQLPEVASVAIGTHPHASLIARTIAEQAAVETNLFDPSTVVAQAQQLPHEPGGAAYISPGVLVALGAALRSDQDDQHAAASVLTLPAWLLPKKKAA